MRRALAGLCSLGLLAAGAVETGARAGDVVPVTRRGVITSFDGTPIVYNLMEPPDASASHRVPTILRAHGWGAAGETPSFLSSASRALLAADYAVLSWDARGFGQSGGLASVDDPLHEGKDASALITQVVATRQELAADTKGPVVGMSGGSYGGAIQMSTAAFDRRVRALAPEVTWNDLRYSLFPHGVIKFGWDQLLYGAGLAWGAGTHATPSGTAGTQTGGYDPMIHWAEVEGAVQGYVSDSTRGWFGARSLAGYGAGHTLPPTLLMQGSVDTFFNLNDAWANDRQIAARGAKVKLIAFCGGHVACPPGYSDGGVRRFMDTQIVTWFDEYLRRGRADSLPPVTWYDQNGHRSAVSVFPTPAVPGPATYVSARVTGTLVSHGAATSAGPQSALDPVVSDGVAPPTDPGSITVPVLAAGRSAVDVVGEPHADLDVTIDGPGVHLFFKLVDREANQVVDLQAESLRLGGLLPLTQRVGLDLVGVTYALPAGHHLDLQISTSSAAHVSYRGTAVVHVSGTVRVPTI